MSWWDRLLEWLGIHKPSQDDWGERYDGQT